MNKIRLDLYLINNNFCETRSQAQQLIEFSQVKVNGKIINKNNYLIFENDIVEIKKQKYVSRGGLKLEKAINEFKIDFQNKVVLDIGASTGGFTDCALQHGAKKVYALDVGTSQLHHSLIQNNNVVNLSNFNLKDINKYNFDETIDIIVCDVSFISLKHVFSVIQSICWNKIQLIFLIKPQFELDEKILKKSKGFINSEKDRIKAIQNVNSYANAYSFRQLKIIESPITGRKMNNIEYLGLFEWTK